MIETLDERTAARSLKIIIHAYTDLMLMIDATERQKKQQADKGKKTFGFDSFLES